MFATRFDNPEARPESITSTDSPSSTDPAAMPIKLVGMKILSVVVLTVPSESSCTGLPAVIAVLETRERIKGLFGLDIAKALSNTVEAKLAGITLSGSPIAVFKGRIIPPTSEADIGASPIVIVFCAKKPL